MSQWVNAYGSTVAFAREILRILLPLMLLVYVPLGLIGQIDGLLMYMTWPEVAVDSSLVVLFFALLAVSWLLGSIAFWFVISRFGFLKKHAFHAAAVVALAPLCFLIANVLTQFGIQWIGILTKKELFEAFNYAKLISVLFFFFAFLLLVGYYEVAGLRGAISGRMKIPFWFSVLLVICSATVAIVRGPRLHIFGNRSVLPHESGRGSLPNVFLLSVDALSAEDMSLYGYRLDTTPQLTRFSRQAYVFNHFYANSNFTTPTTTTIETGKYPWSHRVFWAGQLHGRDRRENIAHELHKLGYYNLTISSNPWAAPLHHGTYADYDDDAPPPVKGVIARQLAKLVFEGSNFDGILHSLLPGISSFDQIWMGNDYPWPAEDVYSMAMRMLVDAPQDRPVFMWAHILPPHDPYLPPNPEKFRYLNAKELVSRRDFKIEGFYSAKQQGMIDKYRLRYDECVRYADREVGEFLDLLRKKGYLDHAIVIITADHGESFSHGFHGHTGPQLYQGLIHIPLIIRLPGQESGKVIEENAEQVDILPTVLDLVGIPKPGWSEGESLVKYFQGKQGVASSPKFSMNFELNSSFLPLAKGTVAVMEGANKYIYDLSTRRGELYNIRFDPDEQHDLSKVQPELALHLQSMIQQRISMANNKILSRKP